MKKILGALVALIVVFGLFAIIAGVADPVSKPPQNPAQSTPPYDGGSEKGAVYYLNFKPEQAQKWEELARLYTAETGVSVTVRTAAAGTYEDTLRSEMEKPEPPTLFQVNGPVGLRTWKSYCLNLQDTALYQNLKNDSFALTGDGQVLAVAYAIETYGIIYNRELLQKAGYTESDITDFESLQRIARDIQSRREELGILGAFTSAGMDPSSDWRFKTHLTNIPLYYEYRKDGVNSAERIRGDYLPNLRAIWDLYLQNATCAPGMIGAKTGDDASSEFILGEAVFYQNGTWAYDELIRGGMRDDQLGMLPIYIGVPGEENQGLCTGSENYWCINKHAGEANIQATKDFLRWVITSDTGRDMLANQMGFVTPFSTFDDGYTASNPLLDAATRSIDQGKEPVGWYFATMPSDTWKDGVGSALLEYAQGTGSWENVENAFVEGWEREYDAVYQ